MRDLYTFPVLKETSTKSLMRIKDPSYDVPKYKWLTWLLRKLGWLKSSYYPNYTSTFTRIDISSHQMLDVLTRGLSEIRRAQFERPKRVYVGFDQFDGLMKDERMKDIGNVRHSASLNPFTWPVKVYGTEIIATPYLDGVLPVWEGEQ